MPRCSLCADTSFSSVDDLVAHRKTCSRKATGPVRSAPVKTPSTFTTAGDATLRDIVDKGAPASTFWLAANQSLLGLLSYDNVSTRRIEVHTPDFQRMVGTILLETVKSKPDSSRERFYNQLLSWKIRDFNQLTKVIQQGVLHDLWECCYQRESPSTLASEMMEGKAKVVDQEKKSLPSSLRPVSGGAGFYTKVEAGPEPNAWKKWQIGFRIEGGRSATKDSLARILRDGCQPRLRNPVSAIGVAGKYYQGHSCCLTGDLYVGYQNRDLYNESGTCVARSLLGATAFPLRETHNNVSGGPAGTGGEMQYQYLFAVNCAGERGLDTEKVQEGKGNDSLWRPGEKAFGGFKPEHLLGYTRIVRLGQPASPTRDEVQGWSFTFVDSLWTWINPPGTEVRSYLEAELAAWTAQTTYNIPGQYDFISACS